MLVNLSEGCMHIYVADVPTLLKHDQVIRQYWRKGDIFPFFFARRLLFCRLTFGGGPYENLIIDARQLPCHTIDCLSLCLTFGCPSDTFSSLIAWLLSIPLQQIWLQWYQLSMKTAGSRRPAEYIADYRLALFPFLLFSCFHSAGQKDTSLSASCQNELAKNK